jgi:hypothetical protein
MLTVYCVGTVFCNTLLKEIYQERREEEEHVSSYLKNLRKRDYTRNLKRKHQITLCGELASEEAMDLKADCGMFGRYRNLVPKTGYNSFPYYYPLYS